MNTLVRIESADVKIHNLDRQIEKLLHMQMWITKAKNHLQLYNASIKTMDDATSLIDRTAAADSAEAHFLSSVMFYHRLFTNQPGEVLDLKKVTKSVKLIKTHAELETVRDHEFTHWRGILSNLKPWYSFESYDGVHVAFANSIEPTYVTKIGPNQTEHVLELYAEVEQYLVKRRHKVCDDLRAAFATSGAINETLFIDRNGAVLNSPA